MQPDPPPEDAYPSELRTPLVDWATNQRTPIGAEPPPIVRAHLEAVFGAAEALGKRAGIVRALLTCWLPALVMVVIAIATSSGSTP